MEELAAMLDDAVYSIKDEEGMEWSLESIASVHQGRCRIIAGSPTITEEFIRGDGRAVSFEISPQSFFQVNPEQMPKLYDKAAEYAGIGGMSDADGTADANGRTERVILDLYCGAGAIGLSMADAAGKVIGVEIVPQAIEDAKQNAARAGITNAEFYCGDAGQIAEKFASEGTRPDIIVLDPPRKGCDAKTLDSCLQMAPARIVMISCNPATAARDAAYLCGKGYSLDVLRPADFFPRTGHVECVVLMSRDNA
jgi:23S rRNA (uracil1939-C5)-methyltransferase